MFAHKDFSPIEIESIDTLKGRFYIIDENTKYPSITTVLGKTADKEWLEDWRTMLTPQKADKETKRCAIRGDNVHLLAERYLNNDPDYIQGIEHQYVKLFNKLKMKLNKIDNIIAQEIPLYSSKLGVAGRTDCVAEYKGKLSLIDFKTSNNPKSIDMIEDYLLQATFYIIAFNEMYNIKIDQIVILIAVEKAITPQEFVVPLEHKYITSLLSRIKQYNN